MNIIIVAVGMITGALLHFTGLKPDLNYEVWLLISAVSLYLAKVLSRG